MYMIFVLQKTSCCHEVEVILEAGARMIVGGGALNWQCLGNLECTHYVNWFEN